MHYSEKDNELGFEGQELKDRVKVATFIGTKGFSESATTDNEVACKAPKDFNPSDNQGLIDNDADGWTYNPFETPEGFAQRYHQDPPTSIVNCAITSSRTTPAAGHDYKIGDTVKIRSGFKIRASGTAIESLYAKDDSV